MPVSRSHLAAIVLLVAAATAGGCAVTPAQVDRTVGAHQPQGYKDGWKDGCPSGYVAAGHPYYRFAKDVQRYAADGMYKQGWDDGMTQCKGNYESIGRSMR